MQKPWKDMGQDKPDIRFGMELNELPKKLSTRILFLTVLSRSLPSMPKDVQAILENSLMPNQLGQTTTNWRKGLVYVKYNEDGSTKSSVDKFYNEEDKKHGSTNVVPNLETFY